MSYPNSEDLERDLNETFPIARMINTNVGTWASLWLLWCFRIISTQQAYTNIAQFDWSRAAWKWLLYIDIFASYAVWSGTSLFFNAFSIHFFLEKIKRDISSELYAVILSVGNKTPDQTMRTHRLVCPCYTYWDYLGRHSHYENMPIQIYWKFLQPKKENFQKKNLIFFIFLLKT